MLRVIETAERNQQWLGVADIMQAEAQEAANAALDKFAARAKAIAGITPDRVVREGDTAEEIIKLIDEDEDIGILVLAAGIGKEGPGRWSPDLAKTAGDFPDPGRDRARAPERRRYRLRCREFRRRSPDAPRLTSINAKRHLSAYQS